MREGPGVLGNGEVGLSCVRWGMTFMNKGEAGQVGGSQACPGGILDCCRVEMTGESQGLGLCLNYPKYVFR